MIKFDDLPRTNRALILAKLGLAIAEANCTNIFVLAHKRHQTIHQIWRDACRQAGQPPCDVPASVLATRDQCLESATAAHLHSVIASPPSKPQTASPPAPSFPKSGNVNAGTGHRADSLRVPLVASAIAILALGVGVLVLVASPNSAVAPQASMQIPNARSGNIVRDSGGAFNRPADRTVARASPADKPQFDPSSVPTPQGTIRRMEEISKAFGK
jgi:hypothetical protein